MLEKRRHSREARNLALAFRGELIAIRRLVAHRKYLEGLARVIDHMQTPLTLARHTSTFCPRARVAGAGPRAG